MHFNVFAKNAGFPCVEKLEQTFVFVRKVCFLRIFQIYEYLHSGIIALVIM